MLGAGGNIVKLVCASAMLPVRSFTSNATVCSSSARSIVGVKFTEVAVMVESVVTSFPSSVTLAELTSMPDISSLY